MKESFSDKHEVEADSKFTKTWTFRNDGETNWPRDLCLKFTNGINMGENCVMVNKVVKPGDYCDVSVEFLAPKKVGSYVAYYKLCYGVGANKSIGKKVWCDILVTEQEDDLVRLNREMKSFSNIPDPLI